MNLATTMSEIATALGTITGLRVFAFPPDNVAVPAAIVGYPETVTYDLTMQRGVDQIDIPVFVMVGRLTDRTAKDVVAAYLSGSGSSSVKAAIKAGTYSAGVSARVGTAEVDVVTMAGVDYLTAIFNVHIYGPGA